MKHKLILTACLLAVCGSLVLVAHDNHSTAVNAAKARAAQISKRVKQEFAQRQQTAAQLKAANTEASKLRAQCQVGTKDYLLLTPSQRLHATLPVCE